MKNKIFLISLAVVFYSSNTFAGWATKATILRYMPAYGTYVYVKSTAAHINPAGCKSSYYYAMQKDSQAEFDEYKKIILTAAASGKKVNFFIHDTECEGSYPKITRMIFEAG